MLILAVVLNVGAAVANLALAIHNTSSLRWRRINATGAVVNLAVATWVLVAH